MTLPDSIPKLGLDYRTAAWWCAVAALFVACIGASVCLLSNVNNVMVHPHNPSDHITLLKGGIGFSWSDLAAPFALQDHRARFLTYFTLLVDYRVRVFLYEFFPVFPTFSVTWLLMLFVSPYLLFRICRKLEFGLPASLLAIAVYMTSTGFLSGFSMFFMPGKPLSMFLMLLLAYLALDLIEKEQSGASPSSLLRARLRVGGVVLLGLFLDELFLVGVIAVAIICLAVLVARNQTPRRWYQVLTIQDVAAVAVPVVIFAVLMIWIVPEITLYFHNYRLNYIGALLNTIETSAYQRAPYHMSAWSLSRLTSTLLGMSLVPHQLSPLLPLPDSGVKTVQVVNVYQLAIILMAVAGFLFAVLRSDPSKRLVMLGLGASMIVSIILIGTLQGRHVAVVTGYYYGCIFSVSFTLVFASALDALMSTTQASAKWFGLALTAFICAVQFDNFSEINRSFVDYHNIRSTHYATDVNFRSIKEQPLTWTEIRRIHHEWQQGTLDQYVRSATVSDGAWYLIAELRQTDKLLRANKN